MVTTIEKKKAPPVLSSPRRAPHRRSPRSSKRAVRWSKATPYLLLIPAIIFELIVHIGPMIVGLWMSLIQLTQFYITNWSAAPFVGLNNFAVLVNFNSVVGKTLLNSFVVTLLFTILVVGFSFLLGLGGALVLQRKFLGRGALRALFLIPYALPAYTGIITWKFMFQRDNGLFNEIIVNVLHLTNDRPFWLLGNNAFFAIVIVSIWQLWPFAFLMTTAAMQSIPGELYEAAAIDGASVWQQVRHITMGMLKPINSVLLLLLFLWTFRDFNTPFVLYGPSAPPAADLINIHIYGTSFINWNFGVGSAMAVLLMLFLVLVAGLWAIWRRKVVRDA
jgi:multiple sugar transport system permease protein